MTDFGDTNETLLHDAITYIQTNAYPENTTLKVQSLSTNGTTMSLYQRKVLAIKTQSHRLNSMFINLQKKK
ncbi:hypothetical protein [Mucilaginibacter sp. SP1R1]|uniref:hypothetical protein n=1 Tax=Mucilaginibacter sp. SP1R1 TaxID=2723091 RepID=UPI003AFF7F17